MNLLCNWNFLIAIFRGTCPRFGIYCSTSVPQCLLEYYCVYTGIKWMQSWSGTWEHQQEVSGEKPEAAQRVGDRMGTKGPSRGKEQVLRGQKGLSGNKCVCVCGGRPWRLTNTNNLVFFYESRSKWTRWGYIHVFTAYTLYIFKWRQLDWNDHLNYVYGRKSRFGAWMMNLRQAFGQDTGTNKESTRTPKVWVGKNMLVCGVRLFSSTTCLRIIQPACRKCRLLATVSEQLNRNLGVESRSIFS